MQYNFKEMNFKAACPKYRALNFKVCFTIANGAGEEGGGMVPQVL